MCMMRNPCIEEIINEIEAEQAEDEEYISEEDEEDQDQVDPAYVAYLASIHQELIEMVDLAGGELDMNVYSRYLFDELYLGRHAAPFYYNLGLEVIYEE